jgi:hypothetical protein
MISFRVNRKILNKTTLTRINSKKLQPMRMTIGILKKMKDKMRAPKNVMLRKLNGGPKSKKPNELKNLRDNKEKKLKPKPAKPAQSTMMMTAKVNGSHQKT